MVDLRDRTIWIGAAASGVWLALVILAWLWAPEIPEGATRNLGQRIISFMGVIAPFVLIWLAVWLHHEITLLRNESDGLRSALAMYRSTPPERADPITTARTGAAAPLAAARPPARKPAPTQASAQDGRQASLGLDPPPAPKVMPEDLVLALNFPSGPDDHHTIAALRKALQDRDLARLIRAAQDVVTLLASHGLYMDDMPPQAYIPALWRYYASGARGAEVVQLSLNVDEVSLQTAAKMLNWDEVFRDAAHHFLRHFDRLMEQAGDSYDDELLAALADTRSGRAFTLLAQVTGAVGQRIEPVTGGSGTDQGKPMSQDA